MSITFTHKNPLLENYLALEAEQVDEYVGFVYMWKCIPERKFYIGSHKGKITDDYRGSGKVFRQVFEYYGITQFDRVILEYITDEDIIKQREQYWMNKFNAVNSKSFLNMKHALKS
jgi:hypothetical protein